jgi:ElaB/YqjD/DUF883 family membrane-anchored ribosome-binding protein
MEDSAERLATDFRQVISDAEVLLRATAGEAGESVGGARQVQDSLEAAKSKLGSLGEDYAEQMRAIDDYVRGHPGRPWASLRRRDRARAPDQPPLAHGRRIRHAAGLLESCETWEDFSRRLQTRLEIFASEIDEQRALLARVVLWGSPLSAWVSPSSFVLFVAVLFWDTNRLLAIGAMAAVFEPQDRRLPDARRDDQTQPKPRSNARRTAQGQQQVEASERAGHRRAAGQLIAEAGPAARTR